MRKLVLKHKKKRTFNEKEEEKKIARFTLQNNEIFKTVQQFRIVKILNM